MPNRMRPAVLRSRAACGAAHSRDGVARRYADDTWDNARDRRTNLLRPEPSGEERLLGQAAMVQMFGLLAASARTYF